MLCVCDCSTRDHYGVDTIVKANAHLDADEQLQEQAQQAGPQQARAPKHSQDRPDLGPGWHTLGGGKGLAYDCPRCKTTRHLNHSSFPAARREAIAVARLTAWAAACPGSGDAHRDVGAKLLKDFAWADDAPDP